MRRTAEDAERTRLALLEAALIAFEEKGWRGATFEHVAERAGVTRGALHHHFRSKPALLEAALAWGWEDYGNRLFTGGKASVSALLTEFTTLLRNDDVFRALAASTVIVAPQALNDASNASGISDKNAALDEWRDHVIAMLPEDSAAREQVADLVLVLLQGLTVTAVTRPTDLPQPHELSTTLVALARGLPIS